MTIEYSTSAVSTEVLWNLLREQGLSELALERETGVGSAGLHTPDKRIPLDQYLRLWKLAVDTTGEPALALKLPRYYNRGQLHFVSSIVLASASLFEGLQQWRRYSSLICNADQFVLHSDDETVSLTYSNLSAAHQNPWMPELYFSLLCHHFQIATDSTCRAREIWMAHPPTSYTQEYQSLLSSNTHFNRSSYRILWNKADLEKPLKSHDPYYRSILKKYAEDSFVNTTNSFADEVKERIVALLPSGDAQIQVVADSYHIDRRTLLRKLKAEGTTFKDLLEDTRKQLAHDYLTQGLSITQISYMLGFTASSSFQVAFKRWYQLSPGDYRRTTTLKK